MKRNYDGCALCNSTWGDVWEEVGGERTFFCCALCAVQFRGLIERIQRDTGWPGIDAIEIGGDRRGRRCRAAGGGSTAAFEFAFTPVGGLLYFRRSSE